MAANLAFSQSTERINQFIDNEKEEIGKSGHTQLLSHGKRTKHAILFFHGYTTCPQQFAMLGQRFFDHGWNVLIPRAPHHGLADQMTEATRFLKEDELQSFAETTFDMARGLGDEITVAGLSMGGVLTAWLAQTQDGVANALVIAPAFGAKVIPAPIHDIARNVMRLLPDSFRWWDPILKDHLEGAKHAYYRFSTYGLIEIYKLAGKTRKLARKEKPKAGKIWMVLNDNDEAINAEMARWVFNDWKQHRAEVHLFTFPKELGLDHDIIEPDHPKAKVDVVYPELIRLAESNT